MDSASVIALCAVVAVILSAAYVVWKKRKIGMCSGGCSTCSRSGACQMAKDLLRARQTLQNEANATLVLCHDEDVVVCTERGVKPLLDLLESGRDYHLYAVADKVVGNGAAYLYVLLGIQSLYAGVMSKAAFDTLQKHHVGGSYGTLVPAIKNRAGDGTCPIELAVRDARNPKEAKIAIENTGGAFS